MVPHAKPPKQSAVPGRPTESASAAWPPPAIGAWRLVRRLASGTMAQVYQAEPIAAHYDEAACYAVKLLHPAWHQQAAACEQFRREYKLGRTISHPHVVSILDGSIAEQPYFTVMPLLEGATLLEMLRPAAGLPDWMAIWIARQIASGLRELHRAGWMHCDVKPANIHISAVGHATLIDLGFAQPCKQPASLAARPVVGTLDYLAPESLTSALATDIRSDIYSLGVVLYEMLTGRLPYEGRGPVEVALLQREGVPDRLRCLVPTLSRDVVQLVRQMLSKEPLRRPQSPDELVERLVRIEVESFGERVAAA